MGWKQVSKHSGSVSPLSSSPAMKRAFIVSQKNGEDFLFKCVHFTCLEGKYTADFEIRAGVNALVRFVPKLESSVAV